jgi:hypothetical protein
MQPSSRLQDQVKRMKEDIVFVLGAGAQELTYLLHYIVKLRTGEDIVIHHNNTCSLLCPFLTPGPEPYVSNGSRCCTLGGSPTDIRFLLRSSLCQEATCGAELL